MEILLFLLTVAFFGFSFFALSHAAMPAGMLLLAMAVLLLILLFIVLFRRKKVADVPAASDGSQAQSEVQTASSDGCKAQSDEENN